MKKINEKYFGYGVWLNSLEAAIYLRKFDKDGQPSVNCIRIMVYRGQLRPRKFCGRLYFKKSEIDYMLEKSIRR